MIPPARSQANADAGKVSKSGPKTSTQSHPIAIYIIERVSSRILEGTKKATQMCIILDDEIAISEYIINEISRGVTVIQVKGGYSGQTKKMIICVVSSREMIKIRQKLAQIDKNAICFIGDIREAFGEGFTNIG